jgi:hypothetical protein
MFQHGQRRHRWRSGSASCSGSPPHHDGGSPESIGETTIVINRDADFKLYEVLRPSLCDGTRRMQCSVVDARIAVIVLDPPAVVGMSELKIAIRVHAAMRRGLLVVF